MLPNRGFVRFGVFELDLAADRLKKGGAATRLGGQPLKVLRLLVEHPGEVVTREDLRQALWGDRTFGELDVGLNAAIRRLRRALGDSAEVPRFIETLPGRGYRFLAPVHLEVPTAAELTAAILPERSEPVAEPARPPAGPPWRWIAAAGCCSRLR
jgi:DNA-binding winged helix-turn-helix (wHTH) protein